MAYITVLEAQEFLGITGNDDLLDSLIGYGESLLNSMLKVTTFSAATYNEEHKYKGVGPYFLNELNPTAFNNVDGNAIIGSHKFDGRMLRFEYSPTLTDTTWNTIIINYDAGFATIPDEVKLAILILVGGLYNKRKGYGIQEFKQGDLSVTFRDETESQQYQELMTTKLQKYIKNNIYSV